MDKQMVEKLKSAIKPVLICDPAAVATAGGRPQLSVLAVTLMIGREFSDVFRAKLVAFHRRPRRCCNGWRVGSVIGNPEVS